MKDINQDLEFIVEENPFTEEPLETIIYEQGEEYIEDETK